MSNFNWCHGPDCHKRETTTRVRGVKGHKVLRTVKIALGYGYRQSVWQYFCDQTCMHDFIRKHIEEFVRIHPRNAPLETPVEVTKEMREGWNGNYTQTEIKVVDNA